MRQAHLFTKTRKEAPSDEVSRNAELLIRAGYIHKELAGAYAYLPLGLRTIKKIEDIIRKEMNSIGGQELVMTALQERGIWETSGRWNDEVLDVWFKTALKNGSELGLATTHEEPLTALLTEYVSSYRDLPFSVYQFQTKFRNELRAKSGIMRGREFVMKDLYSFSKSEEEHNAFYEKVKDAYLRIFARIGLGEKTYLTFASGGSFSKYSHEFQTLTGAGEDTIYVSKEKNLAVNKEVYTDEVMNDLGISRDSMIEEVAVEVGNIFTLGTKFSESLGLFFTDESGNKKPVIMGSYGIGLGRLMGTVVEVLSDDKGIIWPRAISPFQVHLLTLGENADVAKRGDTIYETLLSKGIEVLYDDRAVRAGEKFADADLIGIPTRVIVGEKSLGTDLLEIKDRMTGETREITLDRFMEELN